MNWLYAYEEFFNVNTSVAYNYYRLIFRQTGNVQGGLKSIPIIDTFRLLAAQNVVKYPIATLTSDNTSIPGNTLGNGNYICRASSVDPTWNDPVYSIFNNASGGIWHNVVNYNGSGIYTGSFTTTVSGTSYSGEWIEVQLPNAIQLTSFNILPRQDSSFFATRSPRRFVMAGSNDGVIWNAVHIATGINDWTAAEKSFVCNSGNSNKYNYYRMIIQESGNTTNNGGWVHVLNLSLFAANSVVSSRLVYPPAKLTANTTTLTGQPYGNGTYIASSGTVTPTGNLFNIFDNDPTTEFRFYDYNVNTGVYIGGITTTVSSVTQTGSWVQIQLPNAIRLTMCSMTTLYPYAPRSFVIAGSNDGTTWVSLYDTTDTSSWVSGNSVQNIQVNAKVKYNYYRFIVRRVGVLDNLYGQDICIIYSWVLYDSDVNTPKGLIDGLTWKYFINNNPPPSVSFYTTNTYININTCIDTRNLTKITGGHVIENSATYNFAIEMFGYFRANITGTWTFSLSSDDGSYLWIGANALVGYTYSNQNIGTPSPNTAATYTVTLLAGVYYPIRIHYQKATARNANLTFYFTPPNGVPTYNGSGYFFSSTGTNSAYPAESAKVIKDLTGTNTDGTYYINVNGTSTPTYCLMNDMYDGGGWMMLMKATTGSTFQYSSTHWTTTSTLNPTDLTRNDADAKYNVFNYNNIKDVMAIWPDINPDSYLNVYSKPGGCFYVKDGWVWKVDNWNGETRTTGLSGFQNTRLAGSGSVITQPTGLSNPNHYSGYGTCFSGQSGGGAYVHGFNVLGTSNSAWVGPYVRWGFLFNNEADLATSDTFSGIGMGNGNYTPRSAGDYNNGGGWTPLGINRSARVEMYGR
jgi:hypothetical protein